MIADDSTTLAADRGKRALQTGVWLAILVWSLFLRTPYLLHRMQDVDEGCHAAVATVLLDGGLPYRDAVDNKFPGVYYLYAAVFWVFGNYNMLAVHAVATLWTLATALLLARFAVSLGYRDAAPWTALFYVSVTTIFPQNLAANTEIFMNLPYAASVLALWHAASSRRSSWWVFLAAGMATSVWTASPTGKRWRRTALFGTLAPALISWTWALVLAGETPAALMHIDPDFRPAVDDVKQTTQPSARLFVWGWFTPLYVYTELKPGTRFVFTQIFVNDRPEYHAQDKQLYWPPGGALAWFEIPEAWDLLEADFAAHPPELLLDTSPGNHGWFGPFPIGNFPRLAAIVEARYRHEATVAGVGIYRLKSATD